MRIISGSHKGRTIIAPKKLPVRPTTDFAKEALFNILVNQYDMEELKVLDLFSGTGNIAYEFASRGAKDITAVDIHLQCYRFIQETADKFNFKSIHAIKADVFQYLKKCTTTFNIIFADPPYNHEKTNEIAPLVFEKYILKENGRFILEHSPEQDFSKEVHFLERRNYSKVNFSIFG